MGYTYATKLMRLHDCPIAINMKLVERFFVKLLHKINMEVQIVFNAIYDQVCDAQTHSFIIDKSIIVTLFVEIKSMYVGLIQNKVAYFHLLVQLEKNSTREIQNHGEEVPTGMK